MQIKLTKLRATLGTREEKMAEAEREAEEAQARLRDAKVAYDSLVARMTEELNRWAPAVVQY